VPPPAHGTRCKALAPGVGAGHWRVVWAGRQAPSAKRPALAPGAGRWAGVGHREPGAGSRTPDAGRRRAPAP